MPLGDGVEGSWLIDPVIFDCGLQMVILWARTHLDMTPLPARYERYRRFGSLSSAPVRCELRIVSRPQEQLFLIDILFVGQDGRVLGILERMECPCSRALNRLAGVHAGAALRVPAGIPIPAAPGSLVEPSWERP